MFEKIINYMKEQKQLEKEYKDMENESSDLYCEWQGMLQVKEAIRIISGETESETEAEYNRFRNELRDMNACNKPGYIWRISPNWLNEIYQIKEPNYLYTDGKLTIVIRYSYMDLRSGVSKKDYDIVFAKYWELNDKIDRFAKLHPRIYNKYNKSYLDEDFF